MKPPPPQPLKMVPAAGAAVKVTEAPLANAAAQVAPQETPAGGLVTVPLPAPALLTGSVKDCAAKVPVTEGAPPIVPVHRPLPVQPPPLQPLKMGPAEGAGGGGGVAGAVAGAAVAAGGVEGGGGEGGGGGGGPAHGQVPCAEGGAAPAAPATEDGAGGRGGGQGDRGTAGERGGAGRAA